MKLPVDFPQPVARHMCIDLRGADVRVAEQFLDDAKVRAVLEQMRRKTVPQHVRRDVALHARAPDAVLDVQPEGRGGERRSALSQKNIRR